MKPHFLIITATLFLFACNNAKPAANETTENKDTTSIIETEFTVPFAGFWIGETYYNLLQSTRSARIAQQKSNESFIVITSKSTQPTRMIGNVHEGGASMVIVKNGKNYEFWGEEKTKKYHDIHIISENKLKIDDMSFIKLSNDTEFSNESADALIGEILFKGTYTTENNETVTFGANGKITGLYAFAYDADKNVRKLHEFPYGFPIIDYYGEALDIDQIVLEVDRIKDIYQRFCYKFDNDTLLLYDVKCVEYEEKRCVRVDYGELQYKLVKQ